MSPSSNVQFPVRRLSYRHGVVLDFQEALRQSVASREENCMIVLPQADCRVLGEWMSQHRDALPRRLVVRALTIFCLLTIACAALLVVLLTMRAGVMLVAQTPPVVAGELCGALACSLFAFIVLRIQLAGADRALLR